MGSFKGLIRQGIGRNAASAGASASYQPYQSKKTQNIDSEGPSTNPLPPGNRIGPMNKTRGYKVPRTSGNEVNATVDARIGSGPKVDFDRTNKRATFAPSPTSERRSSGKPGVAKYAGSKKGSK